MEEVANEFVMQIVLTEDRKTGTITMKSPGVVTSVANKKIYTLWILAQC